MNQEKYGSRHTTMTGCQGDRWFTMKAFLAVLVVSVLFAGVVAMASAEDALDLSTLGKKPTIAPVALPQLSATMPTTPASALGGNVKTEVVDLSTLGKKSTKPVMAATMIKGATPITITPSFAIMNANISTAEANTVFTLPQAVAANASIYTPPIAIYGGA
jgi:hypothetical protein